MSDCCVTSSQSSDSSKACFENFCKKESIYQGQKYLLRLKQGDEAAARLIASTHSVSLSTARVLYHRGFRSDEMIRAYLFSSYDRDVPHASLLKGAEVAVDRILHAIETNEKILIFGDYDVDGITSSALMLSCLIPLGASINFFLPNRHDGYGLSHSVVTSAKEAGYGLIITVDNGISAFSAAQIAQKVGIDLIITDHHRPQKKLPTAYAIVNPNQKGCGYSTKGLCGVGVTFKLVSLLYERQGKVLPEKAYELLMLGTIADVVPLTGENRFWVRYGLSKINKQKSYAMRILAENGKVITKSRLNSLDVAFMIAPQLNALGRLSDPRDGVKFLISAHRDDVDRIGKVLLELNEARKEIERAMYDEICRAIEGKQIDLNRENIIMASRKEWAPGVVGLVAGKLMHNFGRPSFIFHESEEGILKGSCRSIKEFNIFDALVKNKELLLKFGGHSFAAGLSLKKEHLPLLKERLEKKIAKELTPFDLLLKVDLDGELELIDMNKRLIEELELLEPFGNHNEEPTFLIKDVVLLRKPHLLKDKHVKCMLFSQGIIKPVIFFNRPDLYVVLNEQGDTPFHVAGNVITNEWNGRVSIELRGVDVVLPT